MAINKAELLNLTLDGPVWNTGVPFERTNPAPIEKYSLFKTLEDAKAYASSNPVAYPGQIITVIAGEQEYSDWSLGELSNDYTVTSSDGKFFINGKEAKIDEYNQLTLTAKVDNVDVTATRTVTKSLDVKPYQIIDTAGTLKPVGDTESLNPTIDYLSGAIDAEVSARIADISALSGEIKDIKEVSLGELSSYEVTVTEAETAEAGYLKTYVIKQGNKLDAKINIPKDFLVKSAEIKTAETDLNADIQAGEKYIDFVINSLSGDDNESHVYLALNDLVDVYTGISSDTVTVSIDENRNVQAVVNDGSIGWAKLDAEVNSWKESVDLSVENLSTYAAALDSKVDLSVAALEGKITAAQAAAELCATNAANTALADAKSYTDQVSTNLNVDGKIATAKSEAIEAANTGIEALSTSLNNEVVATYATKAELTAHETEFTTLISNVSSEAITSANAYTDAKIDEKIGQIDFATLSTDTLDAAKTYTDEKLEEHETEFTNLIGSVSAEAITSANAYTTEQIETTKTELEGSIAAVDAKVDALSNEVSLISVGLDGRVSTLETKVGTLETGTSALSGRMDKVESDITSISNDYATKEYVNAQDAATYLSAKDYTDEAIANIGTPLRFVGVTTDANLAEGSTEANISGLNFGDGIKDGDVALNTTDGTEFVWHGGKWHIIGDQNNHATKTELEAEKQARIAADAYLSGAIDNKLWYTNNAGNIVSADSLSVVKISQAEYHKLVNGENGGINDKAVYIVNSDGAYDMYGERVVNVAAPSISSDAANKKYVDDMIASSISVLNCGDAQSF